jgi:hypothetical protein
MVATSTATLRALLGTAFLVSGCAFHDRHVALSYPPLSENEGGSQVVEGATPAVSAPTIVLAEFVDSRTDKSRIGEVRNGFGAHTADVVTQDDVAAWVREAVRFELAEAGYHVIDGPAEAGGASLSCQIITVHCDAYMSYDGQVAFSAAVTRDGVELFDHVFQGEGSAGTNWAATDESYAETLGLALEGAINQLILSLSALYPEA